MKCIFYSANFDVEIREALCKFHSKNALNIPARNVGNKTRWSKLEGTWEWRAAQLV